METLVKDSVGKLHDLNKRSRKLTEALPAHEKEVYKKELYKKEMEILKLIHALLTRGEKFEM